MEKDLVNKKYLLEKFPGKGGWTYAVIPEILRDRSKPFGWVRVRGSIDNYEIKNYHLMPMGNGRLFLPVKADIRKKIGKKEGDLVAIILYADDTPVEIPGEFLLCLADDPVAHEVFFSFSDGEKKAYLEWIYSAKTDETRVDRIAKALNKLAKRRKFYDREI